VNRKGQGRLTACRPRINKSQGVDKNCDSKAELTRAALCCTEHLYLWFPFDCFLRTRASFFLHNPMQFRLLTINSYK
jgi:hypothetical protein